MVTLSVIVPTIGRATLAATVESVLPQLQQGDELIVVADGPRPNAREFVTDARRRTKGAVKYVAVEVADSVFGNGQRDWGIHLANSTHLCFLDDDDIYRPDALEHFREAATGKPKEIHVFKAEWGAGHPASGVVLWRTAEYVQDNIGTPMICVPHARRMPRWMAHNKEGTRSDFGWMAAVHEVFEARFHEPVVATVRPVAT